MIQEKNFNFVRALEKMCKKSLELGSAIALQFTITKQNLLEDCFQTWFYRGVQLAPWALGNRVLIIKDKAQFCAIVDFFYFPVPSGWPNSQFGRTSAELSANV